MSKLVAKLVRVYFYNAIKRSGVNVYKSGDLEPMLWYKIYMDDCIAATDLTCPMYVKKGRSKNLVVFFYGGGLVYSEETANGFITGDSLFSGTPMLATGEPDPVNEQQTFVSRNDNGLFSLAKDNRFADWNIAAINYGTGDFHVGANEVVYKDKKGNVVSRHLQGFRNASICLDKIKKLFPEAEKLLICGESAGAFGTPAMAPEVIDRYPGCEDITVCSDSALLLRDDWSRVVTDFWKAPKRIAKAVHSSNITADWFEALNAAYGERIKCLFFCGAKDLALVTFQNYMDKGLFKEDYAGSTKFLCDLKHHVERLKIIRPDFGIYIHNFPIKNKAGCHEHCTLTLPTFKAGCVDGISPMEWLYAAVNGEIRDVGMHLLEE